MTAYALFAVAVSIALPLIAFRGRTLHDYLLADLASWLAGAGLWSLGLDVDPLLAVMTFATLKLALFSFFLATGKQVRWSASRAALLALLVYALTIPAMMQAPIDGDEPFYLLITESLVRDHDFDLSNQYRDLAHSKTGRRDLLPQYNDPVGKHGEQYSRHEPFLPILMIPGYVAGGLAGALATLALFGALLARSTVRLLEDEGIGDATVRLVFPFVLFGPPILFYAARIWPEVPAAWLFVEAVRGVRQARPKRWMPAVVALVLLKLRFVLVGVMLLVRTLVRFRRPMRAQGEQGVPPAVAGRPARRPRTRENVPTGRDARSVRAGRPLSNGAYRIRSSPVRRAIHPLGMIARRWWIVAALAIPLLIVWRISGSATNVHSWRELLPVAPRAYLVGLFGLVLDGMSGIAFQAPFYLLGVFALARWRTMPPAFRLGMTAASLYVLQLIPRSEWHGGWSPPLRYITFLMPILALGAATLLERSASARVWLAPMAFATIALTAHGLAYPWRLFHIANGENPLGETLSILTRSDVSRLFPSFIRFNEAALVASIVFIVLFVVVAVARFDVPPQLVAPALAILLAVGFVYGRKAGSRIELEDAHVVHDGGTLYPDQWAVARFYYRGGWQIAPGDTLTFNAARGDYTLHYSAPADATIELAGRVYLLPGTGNKHRTVRVTIPHKGRIVLRDLSGAANLDRMDRD
ncbi:MAG: hypothetical protein JWO56_881 [Acidobacteria bacterium]|nr:hypothetical protein [Acidobacteriota bacterium]